MLSKAARNTHFGKHLALVIQRQVIAVFAAQNVRH